MIAFKLANRKKLERFPLSDIIFILRFSVLVFLQYSWIINSMVYPRFLQTEINGSRGGVNLYAGAGKTDYTDYTRRANEEGDGFRADVLGIEINRLGNTIMTQFSDFGKSGP